MSCYSWDMKQTPKPHRTTDGCPTCGDPWSDHDRDACAGYSAAFFARRGAEVAR